jgi:Ig-like domain from next to BRCA1 gene
MAVILTTLYVTWTDSSNDKHHDQVDVVSPVAVPNPDVPVVILLHGMAGDSNHMSHPAISPGYTYDMTVPIPSGTIDLGFWSCPGAGVHDFGEDGKLHPDPTGWQDFLTGQGYITVNYGQVEPKGNLAPVNGQPSDPVRQLQAIVTSVATTFPGRRIAFVTHSRGGLLLRAWLALSGSDPNVRPRLGTAVQLAPPNQGSDLANIAAAVNATVNSIAALAASHQVDFTSTPLYQLIEGSIVGWPGVPELETGSAFLAWLAANEPNTPSGALLELHTFGGTNPTVFRLHCYVFTPQSAVPIVTWNGSWFAVTFHWSVWDVGLPVRNFAGDVGASLQDPAEIVPGSGDILVTASATSLPWEAGHHENALNHAQALWDPNLQGQALPVLQKAWGSPAAQVDASWAVWSAPTAVAPGAQFTISVTVTNVGTVSWPHGFSVGADDGSGKAIWGTVTTRLSSMARGTTVTVTLALTAPSTPGPRPQQLNFYVADKSGRPIQRGQTAIQVLVL